MKIVHVSADDLKFPLEKEVWENPNIWYHGTSSAYSKKIESKGWVAGDLPYLIDDVRRIIEIYDSIRVRSTFQDFPQFFDSILYSYTLEGVSESFDKRAISLTRDYWRARNYAMNPGGETINALLSACEYFSRLVKDKNASQAHLKRLQRGIDDFDERYDKGIVQRVKFLQNQLSQMKECQKNFLRRSYVNTCESELEKMRIRYEHNLSNSYPVIYVLNMKRAGDVSKIEGLDPYDPRWASYIETERIRSSISPSKIMVRIDFRGGIGRYYEVRLGHWIENNLLPWRSQ